MRIRGNYLIASVVAGMIVSGEALAQAADAYVASGTRCEDVFVRSKNGLAFSPGVDIFAPAFIVRGKRLSTPVAKCQLRRSTTKGEVRELEFECVNPISYAPVKVWFRKGEDGSLIRQSNESDTTGSRYERCSR